MIWSQVNARVGIEAIHIALQMAAPMVAVMAGPGRASKRSIGTAVDATANTIHIQIGATPTQIHRDTSNEVSIGLFSMPSL